MICIQKKKKSHLGPNVELKLERQRQALFLRQEAAGYKTGLK